MEQLDRVGQQPGRGQQQDIKPYEAERLQRIARNREIMENMGVVQAATKLHSMKQLALAGPAGSKPKYTNSKKRVQQQEPAGPTRASRRIRGLKPGNTAEAADGVTSGAHSNDAASAETEGSRSAAATAAAAAAAGQPKKPRFELTDTQYAAPFTLTSVGVTVWELGELYRGPFQQKYWSSRGCLFRHAYPVGYVATKEVFGRTWRMSITAGEHGPLFTVMDEARGVSFTGSTPTKPWTEVCLAQRTGQRISGPQYFGFSDVSLQRAIAAMYNPQELSCALWGTPLFQDMQQEPLAAAAAAAAGKNVLQQQQQQDQPGRLVLQQLSPAELFARELQCSVKGCGAATSAVLATTAALGGVRHSSLAGLRAWLAADVGHVDQLRLFLLTSDDLSSARHLPTWSSKWVPMILQQLTEPTAATS